MKDIIKFCRLVKPFILACLLVSGVDAQQNIEFTSSNLPIVIIDTQGKNILEARKIVARMGIIDNGPGKRNALSDPWNEYNGLIGIEYRGSSTMQFPKKPFAIETQDSSGANLNVSLLGMPEENDWILYPPYTDKSLMRNVLAFKLSRELGHYASRTQYCELVLNGRYWGIYILLEKIKRDKNRVAVATLDSSDVDSLDLTGGYIIKVDKRDGENVGGWPSTAPLYYVGATSPKPFYQYHYPKPDEILPQQEEYIQQFMTHFENMMASPVYDDPAGGMWTALEMGSVIDNCIVNEVSKNVDGYRLSAFMHKDRDDRDPRLHVGPVWDYNLAFGNADYNSASATFGWQIEFFLNNEYFNTGGDQSMIPFWWGRIWDSPRFQNKFYKRWWEVRRTVLDIDRLLALIDDTAAQLDEAQQRNFACWPVLGQYVWPNVYIGYTYQDEVTYLKDWLQDRIEWMDDQLQFTAANVDNELTAAANHFSLKNNYPNPFNAQTTIPMVLQQPAIVVVKVHDVTGRLVATLNDGPLPAGEHLLHWDGSSDSGLSVASGVYYLQAVCNSFVESKKLVMLR